jgi:antitoxin MazE
MRTKIQKWGNSLALRIPRALAQDANVRAGSTVEVKLDAGRLVVEPDARPRYELGELLAGVRRSNIHGEVATGGPAGREVW